MGREIKRVTLDFDWPIGKIWPGYMLGICRHMEDYICKNLSSEETCRLCKQFASLAGVPIEYDCPDTRVHPPKGDGYQLWETTTEGSPVSPVFAIPEELARWLADNGASAFGRMTLSYEKWLTFIKGEGWAPSAAIVDGKFMSGIEAISEP